MLDKLKSLKAKLPKSNKTPEAASEQVVLALDIGTEFVKALIARVRGDELDIIGVGRSHQALTDMHSGAISDIAGVIANCDRALAQAEEEAGVQAKQCVVGIAGELVKGTTISVSVRRKDAQKAIDTDEMQRIINLIQKKAYEQAKNNLSLELGTSNVEIKLVNSALVGLHIDGYKVVNPIGFQGKDIKVQLYTAFAPLIHIGAIERTVRELDLELIAVAAEPFAVARAVVGNDANSQISAILIDVGGGTTDIAIVDDGGVEGTKMFGIGGRSFTKTLAQDLGVDFDRAEGIKLSVDDRKQTESEIINKSLKKTLNVWLQGVQLALGEFDRLDHLPNQIFLCGGGSSLSMLVKVLTDTDWYKSLPFTRKPTIRHISPDRVVGINDATEDVVDHTLITAMGLLRVCLDTTGDKPENPGLLTQKLDKLLSV